MHTTIVDSDKLKVYHATAICWQLIDELTSSGPTNIFVVHVGFTQERLYEVTLVKSDGQKLGLDVDYMAERKVLPIMHVTGGVAEEWNRKNPAKKMKSSLVLKERTEHLETWFRTASRCFFCMFGFFHIKLQNVCFFVRVGDEIILCKIVDPLKRLDKRVFYFFRGGVTGATCTAEVAIVSLRWMASLETSQRFWRSAKQMPAMIFCDVVWRKGRNPAGPVTSWLSWHGQQGHVCFLIGWNNVKHDVSCIFRFLCFFGHRGAAFLPLKYSNM